MIDGAGLSAAGTVSAAAVFVVLATSTVALPVAAYGVAAGRCRAPLTRLEQWLGVHNSVVLAGLLLAVGVVLVTSGLTGVR